MILLVFFTDIFENVVENVPRFETLFFPGVVNSGKYGEMALLLAV